MTLGGGFAAAVPRPVHAVGHELDGGGIHHTHIIETDGMRELREEHAHQLTSESERAGEGLRPLFPRQLREQMTRDEVAHLPQHCELTADWWRGAFFR